MGVRAGLYSMGGGAGLYMYSVVVKTFTFAISSTYELLFI